MFRLYHVPLSPFCRKVRLSLAEKNPSTSKKKKKTRRRSNKKSSKNKSRKAKR